MTCADASFLLPLYGTDVNTPAAQQWFANASGAIHIHSLNDFEFGNALRLLVFRHKITAVQKQAWAGNYESDKRLGMLISSALDANAVLRDAETLSIARAETVGNRCYDILLVAAAKPLGATHFCSFDLRQRELAAAEGLIVCP